MNTIVVTGCAGFIGSHVCEYFIGLDYKVIGIDNFNSFYSKEIKEQNVKALLLSPHFTLLALDICDKKTWQIVKQYGSISGIIHLAAEAGVLPSIANPSSYIHTNIVGTQVLLDFMKEECIQKLIFASSSSVYGNNEDTPFSEKDTVDKPISPYAFTKKANELQIHTWHHLYKIDVVCLRFFTVFGPRQRPDLAIRKFVTKIQNNEPIEMYGDGTTARDYTYIEDTVAGIVAAWEYVVTHQEVYEIINLGNKTPISLKELINTIYTILEKEPHIIETPMKAGDVNITYADISKAEKLLGYRPQTSLKKGLSEFIHWYKNINS